MKKLLIIGIALLLQTLATHANALDEKLKIFEPYLGTWESTFSNGAVDVSHWESTLNGTTLRTLHSINEGAYGGESLIFWDNKKQKLVFFYFTTAGFYTQGELEITAENEFVAFEDVTGNKDGITKVKSSSKLTDDKITVSTSYFKQGEWTAPESRSYTRSTKKVKFKEM
ncbi:hypothetical protein [Pseudoalteromonas piratica]|jgi:hypothetical protein|uniref:Secreted protein n=1 Tax=Pseudoalteromonas piratica TaxID=1348114 RepID=A0A0A7EDM7_9GAMM|nr:hypothetical protein [Pseudoalteromonas piratica]AIY64171.1 hypothetical protein OM33_02640 [Pseudoalteromonas piratica]